MKRRTFETPILTIVGLGFVREIRTLEEALAFLTDWRGLRESEHAHSIALKAVKSAVAGEIETETARGLVEAFARRAGILAPDMDAVIASGSIRAKSGHTAH